MKMLLDGLSIGVVVMLILYQFPRNSRHVSRLPCEDVSIFLEEFHEPKFLFGIKTIPHMSNLGGLIQREWDRLAMRVLGLDGHLISLGFKHDWV
jgi:hypothetical protein